MSIDTLHAFLLDWDFAAALRGELHGGDHAGGGGGGGGGSGGSGGGGGGGDSATRGRDTATAPLRGCYRDASDYIAAWAPLSAVEARAQCVSEVARGSERRQRRGHPMRITVQRVESEAAGAGNHNSARLPQFALVAASCLAADWAEGRQCRRSTSEVRALAPRDAMSLFGMNTLVLLGKSDWSVRELAAGERKRKRPGGGDEVGSRGGQVGGEEQGGRASLTALVVSAPRSAEGLVLRVDAVRLRQLFPSLLVGARAVAGASATAFASPLSNITTSAREYGGLLAVPELPLLRDFLGVDGVDAADDVGTADGANAAGGTSAAPDAIDAAGASAGASGATGALPTGALPTERACDASSLARQLGHMGAPYVQYLEKSFNKSQLGGIAAAALAPKDENGHGHGFTLVQGPPGTGKTTTLLGLLNTLHQRDYNAYFERVLARSLTPGGGGLGAAGRQRRRQKPHILVAAPSNNAVDNIVQAIMRKGFVDGRGGRYNPHVARIGAGRSAAVRAVSVEAIADRMAAMPDAELQPRLAHVRQTVAQCAADAAQLRRELLRQRSAHGALMRDGASAASAAAAATAAANPAAPAAPAMPAAEVDGSKGGGNDGDGTDHDDVGRFSDDEETGAELPTGASSGRFSPVEQPTDRWGRAIPPLDQWPPYVAVAARYVSCVEQHSSLELELKRLDFVRQGRARHGGGGRGDNARGRGGGGAGGGRGRVSSSARTALETSLLDSAHIVCTTLSSTGLDAFEDAEPFDILIVDEAAQSVELSTLVPLRLGIRQCILVGDPKQLPATVFARGGARSGYDISLFERLATRHARAALRPHLLDTQYRMHPAISAFPSRYFYDGRVRDGDCVGSAKWRAPWHGAHGLALTAAPLQFLDLASSAESSARSLSRRNAPEARLCVALLRALLELCPEAFSGEGEHCAGAASAASAAVDKSRGVAPRVAMLTPYTDQLQLLNQQCLAAFGDETARLVEVSTVDGYQGREADVVIFSCVRSAGAGGSARHSIGFVDDLRRMNVALTRARLSLYVVGSADTLSMSPHWSALLDHCSTVGSLLRVPDSGCDLLRLEPPRFEHAGRQQWHIDRRPQHGDDHRNLQQRHGSGVRAVPTEKKFSILFDPSMLDDSEEEDGEIAE
eukprot:g6031.t1